MLPVISQHPNMDFGSVLTSLGFKRKSKEELMAPIEYLNEKFREIKVSKNDTSRTTVSWVMGQLHKQALGNMNLGELRKEIEKRIVQ
jgi:glutamyl-tRNA(Gln) amidotransferase subunit E